MRYSIQNNDINAILNTEIKVSSKINELCTIFIENVTEWGKKFNSELVYNVCKKTVGMIDEDYTNSINKFTHQYVDFEISFVNISKRFLVGEETLTKVGKLEQEIIDKVKSHNKNEIIYQLTGDAQYSEELILEYNEIIQDFIKKIEENFDEDYSEVKSISNTNILGEGLDILVRCQYETLQKTSLMYKKIFDIFLEWYKKTLEENQTILEELHEEVSRNAEQLSSDDKINVLLLSIIENNISIVQLSNSSSGESGTKAQSQNDADNSKTKKENIEKAAKEAVKSSAGAVLNDLGSPEEVKEFKTHVSDCQGAFDKFNSESNPEQKKEKFKELSEQIKNGAKKYAKPMMKALSTLVPLIAPEGHIAAKIAEKLPEIMDCFSGKENSEEDADKIGLALDCMKSVGIDKLPETQEDIEKYIEENGKDIKDDILGKVLSSDKYKNALGIKDNDLSESESKKQHEGIGEKGADSYPQKRNAYDYDFESYDPKALNNLSPKINENKAKQLSDEIYSEIPKKFTDEDLEGISSELGDVKSQLENDKAYVQIPKESEAGRLINELQQMIEHEDGGKILQDVDGKYNKDDVRALCDEFDYEKNKSEEDKTLPNYGKACKNFIRRQMGYPAEDGKFIIKEIRELIPVIDGRYKEFIVGNIELLDLINDAKDLFESKGGRVKCTTIISSLADYALGAGFFMGLGAMLAMSATWPLAALLVLFPMCSVFTGIDSRSYSILVYNLGDRRTDYLLSTYVNVEKNHFCLLTDEDE